MQGYFPGYSCVNRSFKNRSYIKYPKMFHKRDKQASNKNEALKTSLITGVDFSTESSNHHDGPFPLQQLVLE